MKKWGLLPLLLCMLADAEARGGSVLGRPAMTWPTLGLGFGLILAWIVYANWADRRDARKGPTPPLPMSKKGR